MAILQAMDCFLLDWFHLHRHPLLDAFFGVITWAGSLYLLIPLRRKGKKREVQFARLWISFAGR